MVAGRRGVDESDYHHRSWTKTPRLQGGAIAAPNVPALTQAVARLQGAVQNHQDLIPHHYRRLSTSRKPPTAS